jgi:hypothetical protein
MTNGTTNQGKMYFAKGILRNAATKMTQTAITLVAVTGIPSSGCIIPASRENPGIWDLNISRTRICMRYTLKLAELTRVIAL